MFFGLNGPSMVLTFVCAICIPHGLALAGQCNADLARNDKDFCLNEQATQLDFEWSLTEDSYSFISRTCTEESGAVTDLVIAIDRSFHAWRTDKENAKLGADQISLARRLLAEYAKVPGREASLVLYAGMPGCQEFMGGNISIGSDFPCLYVPAGPVDDADHLARLNNLLTQSENLYAESSAIRAGDHVIAADLVRAGLGFTGAGAGLVVMFTDGLSHYGEANDPHVYLKSGNYNSAQQAIQAEFPLPGFDLLIGQPTLPTFLFDTTHSGSMHTMCESSGANSADCDGFDKNDLRTWKVNQLQPSTFLASLTGKNSVVEITGLASLDQPFAAALEHANYETIVATGYSIGDGKRIDLTNAGPEFTIPNMAAGEQVLNLFLRRGTFEHEVKVSYGATKVSSDLAVYEDKEMQCTQDITAPATANPLDLSKLQGGSASCGVAAGVSNQSNALWLLLCTPLLVVLMRRFASLAVVALVLTSIIAPSDVFADGINALHYQPVTDGVAATQKAHGPEAWQGQAALFMDYANDVVELGGEKNKRIDSIMDDLVTAHFIGSIGLHRHVSLGLHVPYVHKSDVARQLDDQQVEGGQIGQPADMTVSAKFRIYRYGTFNFGIMPIATLPQGDEDLLLGDGSPNYGAHFLFSGAQGRFSWASSLGYVQRQEPLRLTDTRAESIVIRGQTISSTGMEYKINSLVGVGGNLQMKFTAGQRIDFSRNSPAEWLSSVKLNPLPSLQLSSGFGTGLGKGFGAPDYRVFAGVAYIPQAKPSVRPARYTASSAPRKK